MPGPGRPVPWLIRFASVLLVTALAVPAAAQAPPPPAPPGSAPWQASADIGPVGVPGGTDHLGEGSYAVRGAGHDIWGGADAFHYLFLNIGTGDDINARATVSDVNGTHAWTKVGLMLRQEAVPESPHHFILVSRSNGVAYQRRLTAAGPSLHTNISPSSSLPVTFELMRRSGHTVINVLRDGVWQRAAVFSPQGMNLIGLAVTSHDVSTLATGVFEDVWIDSDPNHKVRILSPEPWQREFPGGVPMTIMWEQIPPGPATASYSLDDGQSWTIVPGCASVTTRSCEWSSPGPDSEAARIRVVVDDPTDRAAWAATNLFAIRSSTPTGLPFGWVGGDVGAVGSAGSASYDASTAQFTVSGSGADIWGQADGFHYVSTTIHEEPELGVEITARVASVEDVHRWTKAGLMLRAHRGASAAHVFALVTPRTEKGVAFQRRPSEGALSLHTDGPAITAPAWVRFIVRNGDVRAYYRAAATDPWTLLGQDRISLPVPYEAGLAVTSHQDGTLARATFDNVTIFPRDRISEHADIGDVGVSGATAINDAERTLWGSGADIWGTADAFRYHFGSMGPDGVVSARVTHIDPTHHWAKAGVMIRSDLSPGSPHVMLIVSPGRGIAMQYRAVPGGASGNVTILPGAAPMGLRLRRHGDRIIGEMSENGLTWLPVGEIVLPLGDAVTAGLAVTSHVRTRLAGAVFQDVLLR
jgi:hypothetical protein